MSAVPHILSAAEQGKPLAPEHRLSLMYAELRSLAAARPGQDAAGQILQATALVHEAYLRLVYFARQKRNYARAWLRTAMRGH